MPLLSGSAEETVETVERDRCPDQAACQLGETIRTVQLILVRCWLAIDSSVNDFAILIRRGVVA